MPTRLDIQKTYKLFIGGAFPRTESGRSIRIASPDGRILAHTCQASKKDLRNSVQAARKAADGWASRTGYNRGQIIYRIAEMLEGKHEEFAKAVKDSTGADIRAARREVTASIDRCVSYAGWTDKFSQILGCHNPVAGPYYNFTVPEPTGVVAVIAPDEPSLLGLISLIIPPLAAGCTVVALGSEQFPLPTSMLGEVAATSDVPPGVLNLLTGLRSELVEHVASHRDIDAVHAANLDNQQATTLRLGAANNVKRVTVRAIDDDQWLDPDVCETPWWIEPFVEMKTIWHPSSA